MARREIPLGIQKRVRLADDAALRRRNRVLGNQQDRIAQRLITQRDRVMEGKPVLDTGRLADLDRQIADAQQSRQLARSATVQTLDPAVLRQQREAERVSLAQAESPEKVARFSAAQSANELNVKHRNAFELSRFKEGRADARSDATRKQAFDLATDPTTPANRAATAKAFGEFFKGKAAFRKATNEMTPPMKAAATKVISISKMVASGEVDRNSRADLMKQMQSALKVLGPDATEDGIRAAFVHENGREPTEQEIFEMEVELGIVEPDSDFQATSAPPVLQRTTQ